MSASTRGTASLLRRTIHVGHDPLVRRSDRIEGFLSFSLIVFAILLLPLAVWAGSAMAANQNALLADQAVHIHSVTATTTGDSTSSGFASADFVVTATELAPAKWTWNEQVHRADIMVDSSTPAGTSVPIYVDDSGDKAPAPISATSAVVSAITTGVFTWFGTMSLLVVGFLLIRVWLDRSRAAQWDRDIHAFLES